MRILSFIDTDQMSAQARMALDFAVEAREAGHEVLLVGLVNSRAAQGQKTVLGDAADAAGVPFRLMQQRMKIDPGLIGQMEIIFRRLKPDLYQSHDLKGMILYRMARWRPEFWQAFVHGTIVNGRLR